MRICYVVSEYFKWGQFGGYGTIARAVAEGLALRGHEVFALVPKRTDEAKRSQRDLELIEGVTVVSLPHSYLRRVWDRHRYRLPQADLYINVDPRFDSWMAMQTNPQARHCIWFIDPMTFDTFWRQHYEDPERAGAVDKLRTGAAFTALQVFGRLAVRRADRLLSQPQQIEDRVREVFGATSPITFLPNAVPVPEGSIDKAERPLVLFLGRFDWQKQPETFFALAKEHPEIDFVAAGAASDPERDASLRARYADVPNLQLPGVVTGDEKDALLRRAWILCNTSLREGLPKSFQEALAYRCAILAAVDPDQYASRFGLYVPQREFASGLREMITSGKWRDAGAIGREYIVATHERERALDAHEAVYRAILKGEGIEGEAGS